MNIISFTGQMKHWINTGLVPTTNKMDAQRFPSCDNFSVGDHTTCDWRSKIVIHQLHLTALKTSHVIISKVLLCSSFSKESHREIMYHSLQWQNFQGALPFYNFVCCNDVFTRSFHLSGFDVGPSNCIPEVRHPISVTRRGATLLLNPPAHCF